MEEWTNLTLIDENAVERLRNAKNAETARADKAESELHSLRSAYQSLLRKWYALWNEPEYNEAARKVKVRKECEARLAADKPDRYQNNLNRFIAEGRATLRAFAFSNRTNFNDKEAASIYYGIMAVVHKMDLSLGAKEGITSAVNGCADQLTIWDGTKNHIINASINWKITKYWLDAQMAQMHWNYISDLHLSPKHAWFSIIILIFASF